MPSPTSSTVPTERVSAPTSKASMADLMMLVMSWERRAMGGILLEGARGEPAPQPLQAASDTPVDQAVAEPHDDAAEQARIDVRGQLDAAAGELLEAGRQGADLVRVERRRAGGGGVDDAVAQIVEAGELARHARQQVDPAATEEEQDEVEHGTADGGAHGDSDQLGPRGERDGRVGQDARQPLLAPRRGRRGPPPGPGRGGAGRGGGLDERAIPVRPPVPG